MRFVILVVGSGNLFEELKCKEFVVETECIESLLLYGLGVVV